MPDIHGTYWKHPVTNEQGYWIDTGVRIIGINTTQISDLVPRGGSAATRRAVFRQNVIDILQPQLEIRMPLSNWSQEDQDWLTANPEPFCRVEGTDYVARAVVVDVEVLSLSPANINVTLSEGASRGQWVYA